VAALRERREAAARRRREEEIKSFGYSILDCNRYIAPCIYSPERLDPAISGDPYRIRIYTFLTNLILFKSIRTQLS
jgi:hypothetical protein